jgi:uncharacterized protein YcbX
VITVSRLQVAPVKGLAALSRQQLHVQSDGVAEDRRLLLLSNNGSVVTLRRVPELVRVVPDLDLINRVLAVTLPNGTIAISDLAVAGEEVTSRLYGKDRPGRVVPGRVAEALSDQVGEQLRLVFTERVGLGWDEGPVSLLSQASAAGIATPLDTAASSVDGLREQDLLSSARYRMLIEVAGTRPFEEDSWVGGQVQIGHVLLYVTHALERCVVINHHPRTGAKDWAGLKTLAARRGRDHMTLGVIARVDQSGVISVGDPVEPASSRPNKR